MSGTVGRWFLLSALGGISLYVLRATQFGVIFTDWTRAIPEAIVLALPGYAAIIAMAAPSIPISAILVRERVGPRALALAALAAAGVGVALFGVSLVASLYAMWKSYVGPFGLDAPRWQPLISDDATIAVSTLGPAFMGAWLALTSLQLTAMSVSRVLALFGLVTGLAIVAVMPYLGDRTVYDRVLPVVFLAAQTWSAVVGLSLLRGRAATSSAPIPAKSAKV